jgi:hypothetical protein
MLVYTVTRVDVVETETTVLPFAHVYTSLDAAKLAVKEDHEAEKEMYAEVTPDEEADYPDLVWETSVLAVASFEEWIDGSSWEITECDLHK